MAGLGWATSSGRPQRASLMSVMLRLDHPQRHILRRSGRALTALIGGLLIVVGTLASIAAVPLTLVVGALVASAIGSSNTTSSVDSNPVDALPAATVLQAWGLSVGAASAGVVL